MTLFFLLILPLCVGPFLPPRLALRLGGLGVVLGLDFIVYGNVAYDPGAGFGLGEAMLAGLALLYFGAVGVSLAVGAFWRGRSRGPAVPRLLDQVLIAFAMTPPAGAIALILGNLLAGHSQPLAVHLGLAGVLAALSAAAFRSRSDAIRAAIWGLSLTLGLIVWDSTRLAAQIAEALPQRPHCLAFGPEGAPPPQMPLMALTAPKPILLRVEGQGYQRVRRWSFRYHGFVRTGLKSEEVACQPGA